MEPDGPDDRYAWLHVLGGGGPAQLRELARVAVDGAQHADEQGDQTMRLEYEVLGLVTHVALRAHEGLAAIDALRGEVAMLGERLEIARAFGAALQRLDELGEDGLVEQLRQRALGQDDLR